MNAIKNGNKVPDKIYVTQLDKKKITLQKIILLGNLSGGIQILTILKLLKISQHIQTLLNTKVIKHGFKLGKEFTV